MKPRSSKNKYAHLDIKICQDNISDHEKGMNNTQKPPCDKMCSSQSLMAIIMRH